MLAVLGFQSSWGAFLKLREAQLDIKYDDHENKIYAVVEGQECVLNFRHKNLEVMEFYCTFVPESLRHRGIAAELVEFGLKKALAQNKKVLPTCGYVRAYIEAHPRWADIVQIYSD